VRITVQGWNLTLDVTDEGQALPPGVLDRFKEGSVVLGMGIAGMRESARQLGVNVHFLVRLRSGTCLPNQ
jgi:signal transduction histidine kinase